MQFGHRLCPSVVEPAKLSTTTPLQVSSVLTRIESTAEALAAEVVTTTNRIAFTSFPLFIDLVTRHFRGRENQRFTTSLALRLTAGFGRT